MYRSLLLFLLGFSVHLFAGDTFRVEIRLVERGANAPAPADFPDASIPLSASLSIKSKESGRYESETPLKLADVTSNTPTDVPVGVSLQVTPVLDGAKLSYRVQVTHSVPVFSTRVPSPDSIAEIRSTSVYRSGPFTLGAPVWFSYRIPASDKQMYVGLRFDKEP